MLLICLAGSIIWRLEGGSNPTQRPGALQAGIADRYVRSVATGDVKTAVSLSPAADTQGVNGVRLASMLVQVGIDWGLSYGAFQSVDVVSVDEHGSESTVTVQMHFSNRQGPLTLKMVKEGSDWKVRPNSSY